MVVFNKAMIVFNKVMAVFNKAMVVFNKAIVVEMFLTCPNYENEPIKTNC